jgi:hypothetical protein
MFAHGIIESIFLRALGCQYFCLLCAIILTFSSGVGKFLVISVKVKPLENVRSAALNGK